MIPSIPMNHAYSVAEKICIKDEKKLRIGINIDPTINKIFPIKI
jgi:ArsR family metal-binding transcriptional regulator